MIIPTPAESGSSSCNMYSKHILISLVSGFMSVFPFSFRQAVRLIAPVARVLCLQLVHLLHSQLELFILAFLVRVSLVLHTVSFQAVYTSF